MLTIARKNTTDNVLFFFCVVDYDIVFFCNISVSALYFMKECRNPHSL